MAKSRLSFGPLATSILLLVALFVALPQQWKTQLPAFLQQPALHLGLDLAGGTQLDFRISEAEMDEQLAQMDRQISVLESQGGSAEELNTLRAQRQSIEEQRQNLVEAIRTVLERRINSLGVSEATITPSYVGNEKHLIVECPGVVDTQECIKVVGKTIQLEFKEEFTVATDEFTKEVRAKAAAALRRVTESGVTLTTLGQDIGTQLGMAYQDSHTYFRDQLPKGLEDLWSLAPGKIVMKEGSVKTPRQDEQGNVTEENVPGIFLAETIRPLTQTGRVITEASKAFAELAKTEKGLTALSRPATPLNEKVDAQIAATLRSMQPGDLKTAAIGADTVVLFLRSLQKGGEQIEASHILVSYVGASEAPAGVTRTKEQALEKIKQLETQLKAGAAFTALARNESDGPSKQNGGKLGAFGRGENAPAFEKAAFALKQGEVSAPVETQFGYHLIKLDRGPVTSPDVADFDELRVTGSDAQARADAFVARLKNGEVKVQEPAVTLRVLFFSLNPTGWKDTALDGKHFRNATVVLDPVTNIPVVQIAFDADGGKLFQELTKRNIGKPIAIFVGGELVSAPRVQQEITGGTAVITGSSNVDEAKQLAQDLNTGAIPAPIHLVGQYTVEATLGASALNSSLLAALIGTIILMVYMIALYRLLGLVADIALLIYAVLLFALLKLPLFLFSSNYIVLTLAGMAGIILSMGMAVDANVLVFERLKEELRKGKQVRTAVESSFVHAWPAIRDGNVSTLITCAILFLIGTSIVRGFAITLGIGVFLSMFTAITVTRWILRSLAKLPMAQNPGVFGVKGNKESTVLQ